MNTFIMTWNPDISNWKMKDFERTIRDLDTVTYDWAIFDYKKAKIDDRFFMVKCGGENAGIVMSGFIDSKPYKDEDWSGEGREVYYVKVRLESIIHPDNATIITTAELEKEIPGFEWNGGHSGRLLDKMSAGRLEMMWDVYINNHQDMFFNGEAEYDDWYKDDTEGIIDYYLKKKYGESCEVCGFNYKKLYGRKCHESIGYFPVPIDAPNYSSVDDYEKSYHGLCPNCQRIVDTKEDIILYKTIWQSKHS